MMWFVWATALCAIADLAQRAGAWFWKRTSTTGVLDMLAEVRTCAWGYLVPYNDTSRVVGTYFYLRLPFSKIAHVAYTDREEWVQLVIGFQRERPPYKFGASNRWELMWWQDRWRA